ncbi:hypothetical protein [Dyella sp. M7H15-1]|uniref:hypothetical protein n=1 Tax=Dyella sp. M7H15-1 TaxID=2501295 RepID=UPI001F0CA6FD|nr:hypothetical protein [Dyella sp. M7H15-1]
MEEPGRRIVKAQIHSNGTALPWIDPKVFLHHAIAMVLANRAALGTPDNWVFFVIGTGSVAMGEPPDLKRTM